VDTSSETAAPDPVRVVRGDPSAAEVAAFVSVLAALGGGEDAPPSGPASRWATRDRLVRAGVTRGPGAWRASGLPR
jgi:hypothetical protein